MGATGQAGRDTGTGKPRGTRLAGVFALAVACLLFAATHLLPTPSAGAAETAAIPSLSQLLRAGDLRGHLKPAATPPGAAAIRLPAAAGGITLSLPAATSGRAGLWYVLTGRNDTGGRRQLVLNLTGAGLGGAGRRAIILPPAFRGVIASAGVRVTGHGPRRLLFEVPAGLFAVAFTSDGPLTRPLRLATIDAFVSHTRSLYGFAGVLGGMALLLVLALIMLQLLRPLPQLPAVLALACGALAHVLVTGGLAGAAMPPKWIPVILPRMLMLGEGLMLFGLAAWLVVLRQKRQSRAMEREGDVPDRAARAIYWVLPIVSAGLAVWAVAQPDGAALFLRLGWVMLVAGGLVMLAHIRRTYPDHEDGTLITWGLMALWSILEAATLAGVTPPTREADLGLAAGLVVVLFSLVANMLRAALAPSDSLRRLLGDASRRALALTAGDLAVWDLDAETGELTVSNELEHALGLPPGSLTDDGTALEERIHPLDAPAYHAALETALGMGGRLSVQFRLRHADGSFRWYILRGRALRERTRGGRPLRLMGVLMDVTTARRAEERLLSDAVRDRLTGLPNRALFMDRLARALARVAERGGGIHLMLLDVDRFRSINEAWGHNAGDALLSQMAQRIGRLLSPEDTLARIHGDQFAIILDTASRPREIMALAQRIQAALFRPFEIGGTSLTISACMGIVQPGRDVRDPEEALRQAEIALYEAQGKGPGFIAFPDPGEIGSRSRLARLEHELRHAVSHGEIEVAYQPIVRVGDGSLAGFEALVRWQHPEMGLLAADSFVPMAEELGLIDDITRVVLEKAVRDLGIWQRAFSGAGHLFVAVNIASPQLMDAEIVGQVKNLLARESIDPSTLKLEVTESMLLENPELGKRVLERMKDLGVRIACDDFGSGYSALAVLRSLPFSTLKLDRTLLGEDGDDVRSAIIVRSVVDMAHALGMEVIAEGVETEEQLHLVDELGCDMAQGWLLGQAMSATKVSEMLSRMALGAGEDVTRSPFRRILETMGGAASRRDERPREPDGDMESDAAE